MVLLLPLKKEFEKGQTILVVLLVMTVLLTLGLSAVSRSVTDIKISQQTQESARAFWTAQSGLEKALLAQQGVANPDVDGVSYVVTKSELGGFKEFVFPEKISPGESVVYWLVEHGPDGSIGTDFYSGDSLTLYWGNSPVDGTVSALVTTLVYKDTGGNFLSHKFSFDPITRGAVTNFSLPDAGTDFSFGGKIFAYKATLDFSGLALGDPYFLNIKMLFNTSPQILGVETEGDAFPGPVQGSCYESTATVIASNIARKLRECRTWPKTPEIFDYLLFSGGGLSNE